MIRQALLVFDNTPAHARLVALRVAGLSLLDRQVRTLARAGIGHLHVLLPSGSSPSFSRLTRKLAMRVECHWWGPDPLPPLEDGEGLLFLQGDCVHHHSSLSALLAGGLDGAAWVAQVSDAPRQAGPYRAVALEPAGPSFTEATAPGATVCTGAFLCADDLWSGGPANPTAADAWPAWSLLLAGRRAALRPAPRGLWQRVADRRSSRAAKDMLFRQVTKPTSGPISRHLNARISIPISKLLIETGISPHLTTLLLVVTTGLASAYLMTQADSHAKLAAAGLLWQLAAILDRCDGEIARVKLCESKLGAWLDTITDNLAYVCAYSGMLVGMSRLHPGSPIYLYLGISALAALLLYLAIMYVYAWQTGTGSLQHYLKDFNQNVPLAELGLVHRLIARYAFIAKRDSFSFAVCLIALANALDVIYWTLVLGLHLLVVGLLTIHHKLRRAHRALRGAPSASVRG